MPVIFKHSWLMLTHNSIENHLRWVPGETLLFITSEKLWQYYSGNTVSAFWMDPAHTLRTPLAIDSRLLVVLLH